MPRSLAAWVLFPRACFRAKQIASISAFVWTCLMGDAGLSESAPICFCRKSGSHSQKINPIFEIRLSCQANLFQQSPEHLPDGHLPGYNDPPMLLVLSNILIVQFHKIPDIEGQETAFFLNGKRTLFAVGFPFPFQILGMNNIKSPLPQRVGQARVDVFIQE
jgi:hypothetical protein